MWLKGSDAPKWDEMYLVKDKFRKEKAPIQTDWHWLIFTFISCSSMFRVVLLESIMFSGNCASTQISLYPKHTHRNSLVQRLICELYTVKYLYGQYLGDYLWLSFNLNLSMLMYLWCTYFMYFKKMHFKMNSLNSCPHNFALTIFSW